MFSLYIKKILEANVYDVAIQTPLDKMSYLSKQLKNNVFIKREDLQPVFSFKLRGAYNKISKLSEAEKKRGVIAASAGNHAQGVALSATKLGIKSLIVMPKTTPDIKVRAVKNLGAEVLLFGDNFDEAFIHSREIAEDKSYTYIHSYDDSDIIAGQGTIGMEIYRQLNGKLDYLFVPVGGGGLIAGISVYIKYLNPEIKIIGVESDESACLFKALEANKRITLENVGIFADGVAVKQIGKETFDLAKKYVDEVVTVTTDEICSAIKEIFEENRTMSEPAGALSLAGLKRYVKQNKIKNKNLIAIESGANINFHRLRYISERTELGEKKEIILGVTIPERPGSFKTFCRTVGKLNITEFNYRYANFNDAQVFVGVQLDEDTNKTKEELVKKLIKLGYSVIDMSENELAKLHIRYMVGGHSKEVKNERIFRFEFPERSGALLELLEAMNDKWNISMFHYRNHGSAYGRVFMGIQVPEYELDLFKEFLNEINYRYFEETDNPAYEKFLA